MGELRTKMPNINVPAAATAATSPTTSSLVPTHV